MTSKRNNHLIAEFIDPSIFDEETIHHFDDDGNYIYSCEEQYIRSHVTFTSASFRWKKNIKRVFFQGDYNHPVDIVEWPATVFEIHFGAAFNQSISNVRWPESLKKIYLDKNFSHSIPEDLLFKYKIYKGGELLILP